MSIDTELRLAIAERLNRLDEIGVTWDRCVLHDDSGVAYGWIARDDGRSDFVNVEFSYGTATDLSGLPTRWLAVGYTTSSALHSAHISKLLRGTNDDHKDCERVEHVFGDLVNRKVELGAPA